jgi:hypothetical protein
MDRLEKLVAAVFVLGVVTMLGMTVPVTTTHESNVQVCDLGTCEPCSNQESLFSLLFAFPPISSNCVHPDITYNNSTSN